MNDQTFGELMRAARERRGLTLVELARQLKVSQVFLSDVERSRRYPSEELLEKLAEALHTEPKEFRDRNTPAALRYFKDLLQRDRDVRLAFTNMVKLLQEGKLSPKAVIKRFAGDR